MDNGASIQIPQTVHSSSGDFNEWANKVRGALIALRDRKPQPDPRPDIRKRLRFEPHSITEDEGVWSVRIQPGFFVHTHLETGKADCFLVETPEVDGVAIDTDDPRPTLALPGVVSFIYLHFETDSEGLYNGSAVTVEAHATEQNSIHHIPHSDIYTDEQDGDYYILLASTIAQPGVSSRPKIVLDGKLGDFYWAQHLREVIGEPWPYTGISAEFEPSATMTSNVDATAWSSGWADCFDLWELEVDIETRQDEDKLYLRGKVKVPLPKAHAETFNWSNGGALDSFTTCRGLITGAGWTHNSSG